MSKGAAVLVCDLAGIVREIVRDAPFLDLSGALDRPLVALLDPDSAVKAFAMVDQLRTTGLVVGWELSARVADRIIAIQVTGVTHEGRSMLIATTSGGDSVDEALEQLAVLNSEMAAIQRELTKKNAELARLNAHKDAILAYVAHDLRSPLGVVLGCANLMRRESDDLPARHVRLLELISNSAQSMAEMVTDLLDIAAIEAGQLELDRRPLELVELVARAVKLNRVVADAKSITITLVGGDELIWFEGDAIRFDRVMNNLLSNAIKFSEPGASVEVVLGVDANQATVEVRDRGQGIPPAELDQVFEAFQTTSVRPTAGEKSTGLGLAIVKRIVELHEGRVWVESEVGVGTSFHLSMPCCEAPT